MTTRRQISQNIKHLKALAAANPKNHAWEDGEIAKAEQQLAELPKRTARTAANQTHAVIRADGSEASRHVSEKLANSRAGMLNRDLRRTAYTVVKLPTP